MGTQNQNATAEVIEENEMEVQESNLVQMIPQSEIDVQIATAHKYPRSIKKFQNEAITTATTSEEVAASCMYNLPRAGKNIEGPSVRLAEIVGSSWGNMRYGARVIREEGNFIVAHGAAHDLERNVACTIEVRRRIVDRKGKRFNDDMINTTANAACSIALRNAIFRVVPKAFVDVVYQQAKKVAIGDASTLSDRRVKAIDYFSKMGVRKEQVLMALGKAAIEDVDLTDLEKMLGWTTAIKDGETTIDDIFNQQDTTPKKINDELSPDQKCIDAMKKLGFNESEVAAAFSIERDYQKLYDKLLVIGKAKNKNEEKQKFFSTLKVEKNEANELPDFDSPNAPNG